eukprot:SAG11_NODE_259_length_11534_cov_3.402361_11_plen_53_part_00
MSYIYSYVLLESLACSIETPSGASLDAWCTPAVACVGFCVVAITGATERLLR